MSDDDGWDLRFRNPCTFILAGASQSGKTTFCLNVLRNIDTLFRNPKCAQNVLYYYKEWQDAYNNILDENIIKEWIPKLPTIPDIKDRTFLFQETGGSVIIVDDFQNELTNDVTNLFTTYAHHTNSVVIILIQNLFAKNYRDISLNSTYLVLFKNVRDKSQVVNYLKQYQPRKSKWLSEAFQECTKPPYSYMLFDHEQNQKEFLRVRGDVIPDGKPMTCWMEAACTT